MAGIRVFKNGGCVKSWVLLIGAVLPAFAWAQTAMPRFTGGVDVVEVYATVTDANGRAVSGLERRDFDVFEDGVRQDVSLFAAGEFPLTVALGVDRSFSMAGDRLSLAKQASVAFLRALRPSDRSMVVAIGPGADVVASLDMDREAQTRAVGALDAWSTTALYDAVATSLDRLEAEPGRQAVVVFSDGVDRYSTASRDALLDRVRRSRALVYPVIVGGRRPPVAAELASLSGGRSFEVRDARGLEATLQTIAGELRQQYLLGYVPMAAGRTGEWRSVRVALRAGRTGAQVRARDGYMVR